MKLKLGDILNINQTLKVIIDNEKNVDALFKFRLLGIMKSLETHVGNFEMIRNEKIVEFGKEDENGNFSINNDDEETVKNFKSNISKLLDSEVTIDIEKFKPSDIFDKGVKAEYLKGLYQLIGE